MFAYEAERGDAAEVGHLDHSAPPTGAVELGSRLRKRFSGRKLSESYLVVERLGWTAQYLSSNLEPKRLELGLRSKRG